jgi:carbonic anhydrase
VFLSCIDDRLVQTDADFISANGDAFHPRLAGGGGAILDPEARPVALKQIVAAYVLGDVTKVYLQSHTECGAYKLAGVTFDSPENELKRLYGDLDEAAAYVKQALLDAGAPEDKIDIITRVVNPGGILQERA